LWQQTGHEYSIHNQSWPRWNKELAKEEEITLVVQVNGKLRDRITVPASITEAEAKEKALGSQRVKVHLEGKKVANMVYVPGKLINLVVR
jgi:leucyl-tRNA synthetase